MFNDPQCQTANDLHRLVMFMIPVLCIQTMLLAALLVIAIVPGRR